jgi:hypothetical protein
MTTWSELARINWARSPAWRVEAATRYTGGGLPRQAALPAGTTRRSRLRLAAATVRSVMERARRAFVRGSRPPARSRRTLLTSQEATATRHQVYQGVVWSPSSLQCSLLARSFLWFCTTTESFTRRAGPISRRTTCCRGPRLLRPAATVSWPTPPRRACPLH